MEWKNEKDFVCRTKHNLELYQKHNNDKSQGFDFEVTQLVNSFFGLIVFVKDIGVQSEDLNKFLDDNRPARWDYYNKDKITKKCISEEQNFKNYLRHLRNAIAHPDKKLIVEVDEIKNPTRNISKITFKDFYKDERKGNYFETTLTIVQIKKLIDILYKAFLDKDKCNEDGTIDG